LVMVGSFFNQLLPSSVGGDSARVWLLSRARISLTKSISSILLDRVVALFGMVLIVAFGFWWMIGILHEAAVRMMAIAAVIAGFAGVALLLCLDRFPLPRSRLFVKKLLTLPVDARTVFLSPRVAGPALLASVMIHLLVSIVFWILALAIGVAVD